jgi:D-alanyl-D-alanine carboxypeptidase (penicillin-binding protein 5/6)
MLNSLRFTAAVVAALLLGSAAAQAPAPAPAAPTTTPPPPAVSARSYVLMDFLTGQVLAEKDPEIALEPASLTKIMTSYVVSAELAAGKIKLDDPVMISENAWRGGGAKTDGSTSFLPVNQQVPLRDLLYGMIVQSGNDASIALAEHVAGGEDTFAALMNDHAAKLGLTNTRFVNAHGLSAQGHHTTALDVARLSRALIRDFPEDYKVYALKEFTTNGITQHNRNSLLWRDESVDGIKTGHHSAAGYCLAASAKRNDMRLIAVVMGEPSEKVRANDAQALLNYGFRFFESHRLYAGGQQVATRPLWKGEADEAALGVSVDALITIPRGAYPRLKATMDVMEPLTAPLEQGQGVGKMIVVLDGKTLLEAPLVVLTDYPEGGFFKRLGDGILMWWEED